MVSFLTAQLKQAPSPGRDGLRGLRGLRDLPMGPSDPWRVIISRCHGPELWCLTLTSVPLGAQESLAGLCLYC